MERLAAKEGHDSAHMFEIIRHHIYTKNHGFSLLIVVTGCDGKAKKSCRGRNVGLAGKGFAVKPAIHQDIVKIPGGIVRSLGGHPKNTFSRLVVHHTGHLGGLKAVIVQHI